MNAIAKPISSLMLQNCKEKVCTFLYALVVHKCVDSRRRVHSTHTFRLLEYVMLFSYDHIVICYYSLCEHFSQNDNVKATEVTAKEHWKLSLLASGTIF